MVSPAPISSTVESSRRANDSCASRTAAEATDTGFAPMRVSVRARLAVAKACWNRRSSWLPSAAGRARRGPGVLHLAEDLRLAQHQRIQPGGDAEQVAHRVGVGVPVEIGVQVAGIVRMRGQPVGQRAAVVVGDGVELGAVAGRQQRHFAHRRQARSAVERAGMASPANATRSRRLTGAVWWLMPSTNKLIAYGLAETVPFRGLR